MALALLLFACAYEVPLDPDAPTVTNVLEGTVVVNGADEVADTLILLYTADNPPPPVGTGRPVSFATVPASAYTVGAGGVPSAPWALTEVPDGEWLVTALMDVDGNFQPLITATAGSTCGDWLGAYFSDILTGETATVPVEGGVRLDGITVAVGREMGTQRPAWRFTDDAPVVQAVFGSQFQLTSIGVHSEIYNLPGPYDGADTCDTAFWSYVTDADGDGVGDPHPNENFAATGIRDYWPRVYLRYVDDPAYVSEGIPLAAAFGINLPQPNTPTPATTLDVLFAGKALHLEDDGTETILEGDAIPRGAWSVTVVQFTGQTWTLPNELVRWSATDASFDPTTQADVLTLE